MADKLNIANQALKLISARRITDFADDTAEGEAVREFYETSKRAVLAAYPWRFARERASLPADATAPAWGYTYQYSLPHDFLAVAQIQDVRQEEDWTVEAGKLLISRAGPLNILYTRDVSESNIPPEVVKCVAAYLAAELACTLPESSAMHDRMIARYTMLLDQAQTNEARKGRSERIKDPVSFFASREYRAT